MFNVSKNVVCPRCGRTVGRRVEEFKNEKAPLWGQSDVIKADFICTDCRRKVEEEIKRKSGQK